MAEGRGGRPALAAKREQFGRLIARGVGSAEACRIVGVHPKTGKRWRRGRVMTSSGGARRQYAPVVSTRVQVISRRYLSQEDRVIIAGLASAGYGVRAIAARLGRSPATVSRELRRNSDPGSGQYRPFAAQRMAARRRPGPAAASCCATRCCGSSWPAWQRGGARSRSAMRCTASSPASPAGIGLRDHLAVLRCCTPLRAPAHQFEKGRRPSGGAKGTRTPDPLLAKQVLFQLSYSPSGGSRPAPHRSCDRTLRAGLDPTSACAGNVPGCPHANT